VRAPAKVRFARAPAVALTLVALAGAPLVALFAAGAGPGELARAAAEGVRVAVDAVGFVVLPQALFGLAIAGLLVERVAARAAALPAPPAPSWLEPAIESCLLLGMLGTISGMVQAFAGSEAAPLDPGYLVHYLGTALRSSYVGFAIALFGVWLKQRGEAVPA
jgi:hypothetical protein